MAALSPDTLCPKSPSPKPLEALEEEDGIYDYGGELDPEDIAVSETTKEEAPDRDLDGRLRNDHARLALMLMQGMFLN